MKICWTRRSASWKRALTAGNIYTTGKPERSRFTGPLLWERGLFAALAALAAGAAAVGCVLVRYRVRLSSYTYPWREKCRFRVKHKDSRLVNQFVTKRRLPEQNPPDHGGGGGGGGRTTTHTSSGGGSFGGGGRSF